MLIQAFWSLQSWRACGPLSGALSDSLSLVLSLYFSARNKDGGVILAGIMGGLCVVYDE